MDNKKTQNTNQTNTKSKNSSVEFANELSDSTTTNSTTTKKGKSSDCHSK